LTGPVDIEATIAYLSRFKATDTVNSAYDPDATNLHKPRIIKLP